MSNFVIDEFESSLWINANKYSVHLIETDYGINVEVFPIGKEHELNTRLLEANLTCL